MLRTETGEDSDTGLCIVSNGMLEFVLMGMGTMVYIQGDSKVTHYGPNAQNAFKLNVFKSLLGAMD